MRILFNYAVNVLRGIAFAALVVVWAFLGVTVKWPTFERRGVTGIR